MDDEIRATIEYALIFTRDTLAESAALIITDGASVIAPEIARHNAALNWLKEQACPLGNKETNEADIT